MFFIWGTKYMKDFEGTLKNSYCLICQNNSLIACSYRKWFTLFFVPIFPYSQKDYYVDCSVCQNSYKFNGLEELIKDESETFE